jgi:5-methylcytosine-specific restriction endonuclease McrA
LRAEIVRVEVDKFGQVERIFRTTRAAVTFSLEHPQLVRTMPRREAVEAIRYRVFNRSQGNCEGCGEVITWETGEMNEKLARGKGGEQSYTNCEFLCHGCHQGRPDSQHGDRRWGGRKQW